MNSGVNSLELQVFMVMRFEIPTHGGKENRSVAEKPQTVSYVIARAAKVLLLHFGGEHQILPAELAAFNYNVVIYSAVNIKNDIKRY
jgi:hypothetical protein